MKKGFTLIELIITVALLAVIGIAITTNMMGLMSHQEDETYTIFKKKLEKSACTYIDLNAQKDYKTKCKSIGSCTVKVDDVKKAGLLSDDDVYDPKNKVTLSSDALVFVSYMYGVETCTYYASDDKDEPPVIVEYNISSTKSDYNDLNTKISIIATDDRGVGNLSICLTQEDDSSKCSWQDYTTSVDKNIDGSYDGHTQKVYLYVKDASNNITKQVKDYTVYKRCSQTTKNYINDWSACSKSCGGGIRTRNYEMYDKYVGGDKCDANTDSISCNTQSCCNSTSISGYGGWNSCSKSCGGGIQYRTIYYKSNYNGQSCGTSSQSQSCNTQSCDPVASMNPDDYSSSRNVTCNASNFTRLVNNFTSKFNEALYHQVFRNALYDCRGVTEPIITSNSNAYNTMYYHGRTRVSSGWASWGPQGGWYNTFRTGNWHEACNNNTCYSNTGGLMGSMSREDCDDCSQGRSTKWGSPVISGRSFAFSASWQGGTLEYKDYNATTNSPSTTRVRERCVGCTGRYCSSHDQYGEIHISGSNAHNDRTVRAGLYNYGSSGTATGAFSCSGSSTCSGKMVNGSYVKITCDDYAKVNMFYDQVRVSLGWANNYSGTRYDSNLYTRPDGGVYVRLFPID